VVASFLLSHASVTDQAHPDFNLSCSSLHGRAPQFLYLFYRRDAIVPPIILDDQMLIISFIPVLSSLRFEWIL
jgi:hypothetical protein